MKTKSQRLSALRALLSERDLSRQEEVLFALQQAGFTITQATLSRDLKQLKVVKVFRADGRYTYTLPSETAYRRAVSAPQSSALTTSAGAVTLSFAGSIAVLRTRPGYASSVAYNLDNLHIPQIIGTIAGDDTIFIALREGADYDEVKQLLDLGGI